MREFDKNRPSIQAYNHIKDFINYLVITWDEEQSLKRLLSLPQEVHYTREFKKVNKLLAKQGLKRCKVCGRILKLSEYYGSMALCKRCYNRKRSEERARNQALYTER